MKDSGGEGEDAVKERKLRKDESESGRERSLKPEPGRVREVRRPEKAEEGAVVRQEKRKCGRHCHANTSVIRYTSEL